MLLSAEMQQQVFTYVHFGIDDVNKAAEHNDEVKNIPCISKVVLQMLSSDKMTFSSIYITLKGVLHSKKCISIETVNTKSLVSNYVRNISKSLKFFESSKSHG